MRSFSVSLNAVSRTLCTIAGISAVVAAAPVAAQQSLDNFTFHGSVTTGYGKSDGLGVFGVSKEGTFDYRAIALQFGYKFDSNDRVVVQLLHRGLGTSPLKSVMPELYPVYAFYEKKAKGFTFKAGRNPLPRGIYNEVRFIGTLLPLFRQQMYQETLENIDGLVVSRSFDLGGNWGFDANVFGGEFDIKYSIPTATTPIVGSVRAKNSLGTQLWLRTPIKGLRFGAFGDRFETQPVGKAPKSPPQFMKLVSVDGDFSKFFARGEFQNLSAGAGVKKSSYTNWYAQGGIKPSDKWTLLTEYNQAKSLLHPTPLPDIELNLQNDIAIAVNYTQSANVRYKLELHKADGYSFDSAVPTLVAPTKAPFVMTPAPRSKAYYGILSIAVAF
ncbi:MAG: hypothetical protein H7Z40_09610 [Phycisphaerae bacterium]|nr:hypothetical protein [Gemmatimonadaceae bacterium]